MEDFRIWGRIECTAPNEYAVIVTSIPESANPVGISVLTRVYETRYDAEAALGEMMASAGKVIAARGDRVVDTEVDGI